MPDELEDDDDSRVNVGFAKIHGSEEAGLRVTLPKSVALGQGFSPGDICTVFYDAERDEFVFAKPAEDRTVVGYGQ